MSYHDPTAAEAAFYAAFGALDLDQMKTVWLESPASSCIHPGGGLLQGIEAIITSWAEIFRDSEPPQVAHRLIQAATDEHLVVHTVQEEVSSRAGQRRALILATNIYQLTDDGWRMLAHHASLPLVEPGAAAPRRTPLH